jgi:hypothetical protein
MRWTQELEGLKPREARHHGFTITITGKVQDGGAGK